MAFLLGIIESSTHHPWLCWSPYSKIQTFRSSSVLERLWAQCLDPPGVPSSTLVLWRLWAQCLDPPRIPRSSSVLGRLLVQCLDSPRVPIRMPWSVLWSNGNKLPQCFFQHVTRGNQRKVVACLWQVNNSDVRGDILLESWVHFAVWESLIEFSTC